MQDLNKFIAFTSQDTDPPESHILPEFFLKHFNSIAFLNFFPGRLFLTVAVENCQEKENKPMKPREHHQQPSYY